MKFVLSPAKTMDINPLQPVSKRTQPHFIQEAATLNGVLQKKSPKQLMNLMSISQKLADENWERNQEWNTQPSKEEGLQAFMIFRGEVYRGIDAEHLPPETFDYLESNMKILSGLYGLLGAFDFIMPYRLEMGTNLKYRRKENLYQFWGDKITDYLNDLMQEDEILVDVASNEYMKSINKKKLKGRLIEVDFKDERDGKLKSIMTYFKHARGALVHQCAINKVETEEELKSLIIDDYTYQEALSTKDKWVFVR